MTERRVLGRLSHPFIIPLHFAISTPTSYLFILSFCPGGDLFFHLQKEGFFSHERARLYAAEVLLALQVCGHYASVAAPVS